MSYNGVKWGHCHCNPLYLEPHVELYRTLSYKNKIANIDGHKFFKLNAIIMR